MKNLCNNLIKDTKGVAITAFLLLLIPLSLLFTISLNETARFSRVADKTLNYAVIDAVKSAAMMVDPESQAQGNPHIAYERAYDEFINSLFYNLSLNSYGEGNTGSSLSSAEGIKFWMLVYNGDDVYHGYTENFKVASYALYTNASGSLTEYITDTIVGFPRTLYVGEDGITENSENNKRVVLNEPGVLAVVQAKGRTVLAEKEETVTRWAYGKIVKK